MGLKEISKNCLEYEGLLPAFHVDSFFDATAHDFRGRTFSIALSSDNKSLVVAGEDSRVFIVDFQDGQQNPRILETGQPFIEKVFFIPGTDTLVTLGGTGNIEAYNLHSSKNIFSIPHAHEKGIFAYAIDKKSNILYTGSLDGMIKQWNLDNFRNFNNYVSNKGGVLSLLFNKNLIYSGNVNGMVNTWDEKLKHSYFKYHEGHVFTLLLNENLNCLLTGGSDGHIRFWDRKTNEKTLEINTGQQKVMDILLLEAWGDFNKEHIMTAGGDGTVKLWMIQQGTMTCLRLLSLKVQKRTIEKLIKIPNESRIFTVSSSGMINTISWIE
jgi:WD40 repeat protein